MTNGAVSYSNRFLHLLNYSGTLDFDGAIYAAIATLTWVTTLGMFFSANEQTRQVHLPISPG
jgi:hypothetical protein